MDDNEKKNIDGIKPNVPQDTSEKPVNTIEVTSDDSPSDDQTVSITNDGEIASTDSVVQEEVIAEETKTDALSEEVSEAETPEAPFNEDMLNDTPASVTPPVVQSAIDEQSHVSVSDTSAEVSKLKERNKHLRIWLAVLVILMVGLASALVVYFAQQSKAQSDLDAANQENAALQQQIAQQESNATQTKVTELQTELDAEKAKNAELTAENKQLSETIAAYEIATNKLIELCGDKCSTVTIPDATTTETTPTE